MMIGRLGAGQLPGNLWQNLAKETHHKDRAVLLIWILGIQGCPGLPGL